MTDQNVDRAELWANRGQIMSLGLRGNLQAAAADRQRAAQEAARQVANLDETDREALFANRGQVLGSAMITRARVPNEAAAVLALTEASRRDEEGAAARQAQVDRIVRDAVRAALATTNLGEAAKPARSRKRPAARSTVVERFPGCPCLTPPAYSLDGCRHIRD